MFTAHIQSTAECNVFSLFTPGGGGGLPNLHPIILPLVPYPFWGGGLPNLHPIILPLVLGPFPGEGVPQSQMGGTPGWGPPSQARMGYPPYSKVGIAHTPARMGYPLARSGWGTPWPGMGVPPSQDGCTNHARMG